MRFLRRFLARLKNFATGRRDDQRLREEMEEHLARQTEENLRAGMNVEEARRGLATSARHAVCGPAHVTRLPDTEFGARFTGPHFPWPPPLAPSTPPLAARLRSWTSQLLRRGLTSRVRSS